MQHLCAFRKFGTKHDIKALVASGKRDVIEILYYDGPKNWKRFSPSNKKLDLTLGPKRDVPSVIHSSNQRRISNEGILNI